ncbi:hypothetical protein AKO1_015021 [Acrasis kona]|uniref:NGG1p interacting factor NIF3 n=1 Tax=Acrasis kona TaxID=1008807 RepID=A0AAW2Z230_9EUKA
MQQMPIRSPSFKELASFISYRLHRNVQTDVPLIQQWTDKPISSVCLMLEPINFDLHTPRASAYFLHRIWGREYTYKNFGIIGSHSGFDQELTTNYNIELATQLGASVVTPVFRMPEQSKLIGMFCVLDTPVPVEHFYEKVKNIFQCDMEVFEINNKQTVSKIAVMFAFNDLEVRRAKEEGVDVYITGQTRPLGRKEAEKLEVALIAVGHRNSELWGLRQLAVEIKNRFPEITVDVLDQVQQCSEKTQ